MATNFDINGTTTALPSLLMISASAGTGKTYTITDLAARWMLENNQRPESLLMVTFSREAARELKSKLRTRVKKWVQALEEISNGTLLPDSDEVPREAAKAVSDSLGIEVALSRMITILSDLDEVSARTIHSFIGTITKIDSTEQTSAKGLVERAVHEELIWRANTTTPIVEVALAASGDTSKLDSRIKLLDKRMRDAVEKMTSAGDFVTLTNDPGIGFQQVLEGARARVKELRQDEEVSTFDGMIVDLATTLEMDAQPLAVALRDQYKLVMIDEFQDTDKLQWEIFQKLFRDPTFGTPTSMVLVGDPKQAIYGFRGGDVEVFRAQQQEIQLSEGESLKLAVLNTNYRSHEPVVAAYNGLFLFADQRDWKLASEIPAEQSSSGTAVPALEYQPVFAAKQGEGRFEIRRVEGSNSKAESIIRRDVCNEVVRLLKNGVAAPDIAILCARTAQLKMIGRELKRRNVLSVNVRVDNVFASDAAWQLRMLLWILDEPNNPRRIKLLPASWFVLEPREITELSLLMNSEGFAAVHRRILNGKTLRRVLTLPQAERNYTDLEHLCELVDVEFPRVSNPLVLRRWLEQAHEEAVNPDDESARRRIESDANAVRLTTSHSSKGLEWKHVLVADLHMASAKNAISTYTNSEGRVVDVGSVLGGASAESKSISESRRIDETRRLIYVALTRGKESVVSWIHTETKEPNPFVELANLAYSAISEGAIEADVEEWRKQHPGLPIDFPVVRTVDDDHFQRFPDIRHEGDNARALPTYTPSQSVAENKRRWSYSGLGISSLIDSDSDWDAPVVEVAAVKDEDVELDDGTSDDPGRNVFGELRGASLGLAIHRYFELTIGGPKLSEAEKQVIVSRAFGEFGILEVPSDMLPKLENLTSRSLGSAFNERSFDDFAGSANRRTSAEMRFTLPLVGDKSADQLLAISKIALDHEPAGQFAGFFARLLETPHFATRLTQGFLTGSLDLVINTGDDENPKMFVVDYKTNGAPVTKKYDPESLNQEMIKSGYPMQALLYVVALYRFLRSRTSVSNPEELIGGVLYYYVRGALVNQSPNDGLMTWAVPGSMIVAVSNALDGRGGR